MQLTAQHSRPTARKRMQGGTELKKLWKGITRTHPMWMQPSMSSVPPISTSTLFTSWPAAQKASTSWRLLPRASRAVGRALAAQHCPSAACTKPVLRRPCSEGSRCPRPAAHALPDNQGPRHGRLTADGLALLEEVALAAQDAAPPLAHHDGTEAAAPATAAGTHATKKHSYRRVGQRGRAASMRNQHLRHTSAHALLVEKAVLWLPIKCRGLPGRRVCDPVVRGPGLLGEELI